MSIAIGLNQIKELRFKLPRTVETILRIAAQLRVDEECKLVTAGTTSTLIINFRCNGEIMSTTTPPLPPSSTSTTTMAAATTAALASRIIPSQKPSAPPRQSLLLGVNLTPSRWPLTSQSDDLHGCIDSVDMDTIAGTLTTVIVEQRSDPDTIIAMERLWEASHVGYKQFDPALVTNVDPVLPEPYAQKPAAVSLARAIGRIVISQAQMRSEKSKVVVSVRVAEKPPFVPLGVSNTAFVVAVTGIIHVGPSLMDPSVIWGKFLTDPVSAPLKSIVDLDKLEIRVAVKDASIVETERLMKTHPNFCFAGVPFSVEQKATHKHHRPREDDLDDVVVRPGDESTGDTSDDEKQPTSTTTTTTTTTKRRILHAHPQHK